MNPVINNIVENTVTVNANTQQDIRDYLNNYVYNNSGSAPDETGTSDTP